jgi:ubiquinone/menaquinone biosynthesis C-methylase UbiE
MTNDNLYVKTAYDEDSSKQYDDKRFTTPHGLAFHSMEVQQLLKAIRQLKKGSGCLEVGCGTGRFLYELAKYDLKLEGVDPSSFMLAEAQKKCANFTNVKFRQAEGISLPYNDGSFEFVYSIRTLNQTESKEYAKKMIREIIRVTKPDGMALIEFCNEWRPFKQSKTVRLSVREIKRLIAEFPGVQIIQTDGILILSGWLLNRVPSWLLPWFTRVDGWLSHTLPWFASRCYVTLKWN